VVGPIPPPIHGAAKVTAQVVANLQKAGADLITVSTSGPDGGSRLRYHRLRITLHLRAAATAWRARRRPTSLYVAGAGGLGLWYQVVVIAAGRLAGHRLVFHHHSYAYVTRKSAAMSALSRAGGRRLEHIALCEGMGETLRGRYPLIDRVSVCSNAGLFEPLALDDAELPRAPRTAADPLVLGHLGNLCVEKGLDVVIDTLRRLHADGVPARLLLAGPLRGPEAVALLAGARAEFGNAVEHLGPIDPAEVDSFYRRLDVFVFPSRYQHEAEPMVVLEASRCGVPTVAFRVGCLASMVPDAAWLVSETDDFPGAAARAVSRLIDDATRHASRGIVLNHFAHRQRAAVRAQDRLQETLMEKDAS
jgi:glycosyltransferase involved in cell wall biosynthesis